MKVYQIVEGRHDHHKDSNGLNVLPNHTGSVTLLHGDFGRVLIDTGSRGAWEEVRTNLAQKGVMPEDIDVVLLTHFHLDHCFNLAHFTKARVFAWAHEWAEEGTFELVPDIDAQAVPEVVPGIWAIRAPGHDECLNAYFTEAADSLTLQNGDELNLKGKRLCFSGDALNEALINSGGEKLHYTYDKALMLKSAQKVLDEKPDYIIAGHGRLIIKPKMGWPKVG